MTLEKKIPTCGMVLAAGLGRRMGPLTDVLPKPMVRVAGRALIDHALDRLAEAGVGCCVVNLHHWAPLLREHLAERTRPRLVFSDETAQLLETGGGVAKALPLLGEEPFFVANADALWRDGPEPALHRLAAVWDEGTMDALLLLVAVGAAHGYDGEGDFHLAPAGPAGRPERRAAGTTAPYVFGGVQILHPRLFAGAPAGAFSLNVLYDRAGRAGRLKALVHDGAWFHVGTPAHVALAESGLSPTNHCSH
ncbi:MAG: nucleotidyltransferase [Rhodospirillaceae bacterium]|nr:MAG: nucleotidyltransferase [Rhodospirillaceae bacterium]